MKLWLQKAISIVLFFSIGLAFAEPIEISAAKSTLNNINLELFEAQQDLSDTGKERVEHLKQLKRAAERTLVVYQSEATKQQNLLRSQAIADLQKQQAKTEALFQVKHKDSQQQLNKLNQQLNSTQDKAEREQLAHQIYTINEQINSSYLKMLTGRYKNQIQQLKISIVPGTSITLLNNYKDQVQVLNKDLKPIEKLAEFATLNQDLAEVQTLLNKTLKQELSRRQTLPGFDERAWLDLSAEILVLPGLAYHEVKTLTNDLITSLADFDFEWWMILAGFEVLWWGAFYLARRFLKQQNLVVQLFQFLLVDIAVIGNALWLFYWLEIPREDYYFFINLAAVWLVFKGCLATARIYLVETFRLRWMLIIGGIITGLVVLVSGLAVSYELKTVFARLFLIFLFIMSLGLFKSPSFISRFVALLLIINSIIGLSGYINMVYTIFWYEGILLLVLIGYFIARAILVEIMDEFSKILISHVSNGWLLSEAFLKPLDRVLRIALILLACAALFILYGWDRLSPIVERLNKLIHYRLGSVFNTIITPLSIVELVVIISLLYWAAKWTREFVYRLLTKRTEDLGVRNSLAILSQYLMITIGIIIGLEVLGVDFKAVAAVAIGFGAVIGFGVRDLINNLASGFLLLIERPLRVGDTVTIDGHEGDVIHLGSRAVTVRTWDHMDIVVPNADICNKTFINWTAKDNIVRTVARVILNQAESPFTVQKIIYDVLAANPKVLKDPAPEVFMKELGEGTVDLEVRYFINLRLVKSRPSMRSEVLLAIWEAFDKQGIKPAYPIRRLAR